MSKSERFGSIERHVMASRQNAAWFPRVRGDRPVKINGSLWPATVPCRIALTRPLNLFSCPGDRVELDHTAVIPEGIEEDLTGQRGLPDVS